MAENINITCNIKNGTGNKLTVFGSDLSWGKFQTNPSEISKDSNGNFKASGRKDSASGTEGYVTYQAFDGTLFKINFDIKWGAEANSISWSVTTDAGKGNPSHFDFYRTKSDYETPETSGDPGSSPVTVYFLIAQK
ncbi:MAG TPA: aegerolysin family protein [Rickettsiales bacterium]|nr:aegerolysin family protein [Rickettsiales bacterium]